MPVRQGQILIGVRPIFQYLTESGNGLGNTNANGNYLGGATTWYIQPPPGEVVEIGKMLLFLAGSGAFGNSNYGSLATLTNGITIRTRINSITDTSPGASPIRTNRHLQTICTDFKIFELKGNDWMIRAEIDFDVDFNTPLILIGTALDRLEVVLNDNFTGLSHHSFSIFGRHHG